MGNKTKPRIDQEDRELMRMIAIYGFVDMCFVYKFYKVGKKERTIEERIMQLAQYGYLQIRKTYIPQDYTLDARTGYKAITLGKVGLQAMHVAGYPVTDYRDTLRNAAPYRVYHQVQVATVCEYMKRNFNQSADSKFKITRILSEKESCLPKRINQPDGIILLERKDRDLKGNIAIFIEVERSYASKDRIHSKLSSYATAFDENAYSRHLKIPIIAQRVLFISQTNMQIETIHKKIEQSPHAKEIEILTTKYTDVCERTLEEVYRQPVHNYTYRLLQNMNKHIQKKNEADENY